MSPGVAGRHRVVFRGAIYHVMARGNRKQTIFADGKDRRQFLKILAAGLQRYGVECYAYCLMGNHFHLIVRTPRANISRFMHHVDGLYARYVNWRHQVTGHLFQGRYVAILVDDTSYLRDAISYILRNPVTAGVCRVPELWPWSSYNATMGTVSPGCLTLTWLPSLFGAPSLQESRMLLTEYIKSRDSENVDLARSVAEGTHEFKTRIRKVVGATLYCAELPRAYRSLGRPSLSEVFASTRLADRRATILRAHVVHGYLLSEVAHHLELHPTTVSRIVNQTGSYRLIRD